MNKTPEDYYAARGCEKKALFIVAVVIGILLLFSCEKDQCVICTTRTTLVTSNCIITAERTCIICDASDEVISDFERVNTYNDPVNKTTQTCRCK